MAKKKEPINLMPPEPKKVRVKNINRIFNSNFSQTFCRLEKNLLQELLYEKIWFGIIQKVCLLETSKIWNLTPCFPCSSLSLEFSNGKLVSVFVNSKDKLLIFFTVVYIMTLKVFTYSSKKVKWKKIVYDLLIKKHLYILD